MKKDIRYDLLIFQQLRVVQFDPYYFGVLIPQRSAALLYSWIVSIHASKITIPFVAVDVYRR